jgi:hypothetical protein
MRFNAVILVAGLLGTALGQAGAKEPEVLSPCTNLANAIQHMAELQAHLQGLMFLGLRGAPANIRQATSALFASLEEDVTKADQIRIKSCNNEDTLSTVRFPLDFVVNLLSHQMLTSIHRLRAQFAQDWLKSRLHLVI